MTLWPRVIDAFLDSDVFGTRPSGTSDQRCGKHQRSNLFSRAGYLAGPSFCLCSPPDNKSSDSWPEARREALESPGQGTPGMAPGRVRDRVPAAGGLFPLPDGGSGHAGVKAPQQPENPGVKRPPGTAFPGVGRAALTGHAILAGKLAVLQKLGPGRTRAEQPIRSGRSRPTLQPAGFEDSPGPGGFLGRQSPADEPHRVRSPIPPWGRDRTPPQNRPKPPSGAKTPPILARGWNGLVSAS